MDATPVTNREFGQFVKATEYVTDAELAGRAWEFNGGEYFRRAGLCWKAYASADRDDHPVVLVSWHDAVAFANWAGKQLPTEAQWERAARGGLAGALYPWGDEPPKREKCTYGSRSSAVPPTAPVRCFTPNGYGLYDVVGNVWQWCADWFSPGYYHDSPRQDPSGPASGIHRVRRGGAWNVIHPFRLRVANRAALHPSSCAPNVGFRCVWTARSV